MTMNDEITLFNTVFEKDSEGYNKLTAINEYTVFAEVSSPKRQQRDSALKHDYVASLTVKMHSDEYSDESYLKFNSKLYEIQQTYEINDDVVEITCSDWRLDNGELTI